MRPFITAQGNTKVRGFVTGRVGLGVWVKGRLGVKLGVGLGLG
jgi:hypothetical protein